MELTYENMRAHIKKFFDLLPTLTPENKHEMEKLHAPDSVASYPGGDTEAEHVSAHADIYRAHIYYEPWPLYIMVDESKKMVNCVIREESRHPVTGELVKAGKYHITGEPIDTWFINVVFELTVIDNAIKIKNTFLTRIDHKGVPWLNWSTLAKHGN